MVGDIKAGIRTHTGEPEVGPPAEQVEGEEEDCESGDFGHYYIWLPGINLTLVDRSE